MYLPAPSEGGSYTPPPVGTHLALCYRIIDLGTQKTTYNGETKTAHKLMISWELPQERMDDGRPFAISKRCTRRARYARTWRRGGVWRSASAISAPTVSTSATFSARRACSAWFIKKRQRARYSPMW
jgi:hypothetical protein